MGERSLFWNTSPTDPRTYQAEDLAIVLAQIIGTSTDYTKMGTGVSRYNSTGPNGLMVSANSTTMATSLSAGFAFINGKMYVNDSAMSLTHDAANATQPRIDRVVIRYDANNRTINAVIKKGANAATPTAPALQNDAVIKEISVAQVRIVQGRSFITPTEVTDERSNAAVCGFLPLHNLYQGIAMSPEGVATFPNQSYVESTIVHPSPFFGIPQQPVVGTLPIYPTVKDSQQEVTADHKFKPKVSGVYQITMYLRFQNFVFPAGESIDVQSFLKKNGVDGSESQAVIARRTNISGDNIFQGTAIESLNAGDEISFSITYFGTTTNPPVILNQQVRITKVS